MKKMLCAATAVIICNIGLTGCGAALQMHIQKIISQK